MSCLNSGDGEFVPPVPVQPLITQVQPDEEKKKQGVSFSMEDTDKVRTLEDRHHDTKKNKVRETKFNLDLFLSNFKVEKANLIRCFRNGSFSNH